MEKLEMEAPDSSLMDKPKKLISRTLNKYERIFQPCLAEVLGTMFFVFVGCVSVIENLPAAGRLQPALVHGLALVVLVAVMDKISGSHFNPSFTVAICLCGGMELAMVAPYLVSQLVGGVLGAGMAKLMTSPERFSNASGAAFDLLRSESQLYRALFGEVAMTCLVTLVVLMVAVNSRTKTPFGPFLVGSTIMFNILAGCLIVYPWTQRYFASFGNLYNADAIKTNPNIQAHGTKILHGLDRAVKNMDDIKTTYAELSVLHSEKLHVDPDNFKLLADCLTIVIAAKMGSGFTPEIQETFQKFLAVVVSALGKQYH